MATAAALASVLALAACSPTTETDVDQASDSDGLISDEACQRNEAAGTINYIAGYGYSASAGQMDVYLAKDLGYFDDLCLTVDINASGANGQQLLSSGQAQFTELGSATDVLLTQENSENVIAIAEYGQTDPHAIFTNADVKDLKDLEGGTLGYFGNLTPSANAMLDAAGADIDTIEIVKMTNYDPTVVVRGQVDGIVGYLSSQVETLKADGEDFNYFTPSDFDVEGTYNIMEVNSTFLENNREVVADFMRASLKALEQCLDDEDFCVTKLAELAEQGGQGDAFSEPVLRRTWKVESQYVRDRTTELVGQLSPESWEASLDMVQKYNDVPESMTLDGLYDTDLIPSLYDGGDLIWPGD